jgi:DNA-binding Lrp family transcriptional regulator
VFGTPYHPGRSYTVDDWARIRDVYAATLRSGGLLTRAAAELAAALGRSPNAVLQRFSMLRQGSCSRRQTGVHKRVAVCHDLLRGAVVSPQSPQSVQPESLTELESDAVDLVYRHFVRVGRQDRAGAAQLLHRTMGISTEKVLKRFDALGKAGSRRMD